jgi:hypothetical protein
VIVAGGNLAFSAALSSTILGEDIPLHTFLACMACFGSILLVFGDQLGSSNGSTSALGEIYALLAALTLALYFVLVRLAAKVYGKEPDMVPCNIIAGIFVGLVALICGAQPTAVQIGSTMPVVTGGLGMGSVGYTINGSQGDFLVLLLVLQGCLLLSLSFALLTLGAALVPAAEVSMLMLLETVLGPVWVWLGGYEAPPRLTVYGGAILVASLAAHSVAAIRAEAEAKAKTKTKLSEKIQLAESDENEEEVVGYLPAYISRALMQTASCFTAPSSMGGLFAYCTTTGVELEVELEQGLGNNQINSN